MSAPTRNRRRTGPPLDLPPGQHGTITGYNKGCPCDPCREAATTSRREQRHKAQPDVKPYKPRKTPLSSQEVAVLRAAVPCHGCGAVRQQHEEKTRIVHKPGCPVRGIPEGTLS